MINKSVVLIAILIGIFQGSLLVGGEIIVGKACYRFSDQESIAVARDIALSLAKRDALESYAVFVNATATVKNYKLKNSIITSVSASVLNNMKIIEKKENLEKREVCRAIRAEVEKIEVMKEIKSRIRLSQRKYNFNTDTGLYEDHKLKVIKISKNKERIELRAICKKRGIAALRVTYFDNDGLPSCSDNLNEWCVGINDVKKFIFNPKGGWTCKEEVVDYTLTWDTGRR